MPDRALSGIQNLNPAWILCAIPSAQGLTVHARGLPVISLPLDWGGSEGSHTTAAVSPFLSGAS